LAYWRSLEAIETWRRNAQHLVAKDLGKQRFFASHLTRIARVEQVY
jgi:heme-degrading monooxygenase HmoA